MAEQKHIDPLARYRALVTQMTKDTTGVYPVLDYNSKVEILTACIKAAAISNGLEELKQTLSEGLELSDVTVPETK